MIDARPLDLSPAGLERSAALLRASMPRATHMTAAFLHWQYVENPAGAAIGLEAFDGDRAVSHCVVQPLRALLRGREVTGVMSMNAATLPSHLGRGIYFGLAEQVYAMAREAGHSFGVAVTNDQSTPGFIRHCGFRLVRPLDARLGLGSLPMPRAGESVDFAKAWDDETTAWRLRPPHVHYRFVAAGDRARVFAPSGMAGIDVELGEVPGRLVPPSAPRRAMATNPLRLWVGHDDRLDWKGSLFWNLPLKVRPSPLNLIFADLTTSGIEGDALSVRWNGLDFDDF